MKLVRTAQPLIAECPVTLTEAMEWCRIDSGVDNAVIERLIIAGTTWAEEFTRRSLSCNAATTSSKWTYTIEEWPTDTDTIELPRPPLISVSSVKYYDETPAQQTWSSTNYHVVSSDFPGKIVIDDDADLPDLDPRPEAIEIIFVAGYSAASAVEGPIKDAILCYVAHRYRTREPESVDWIEGIKGMLYPHKLIGIGA